MRRSTPRMPPSIVARLALAAALVALPLGSARLGAQATGQSPAQKVVTQADGALAAVADSSIRDSTELQKVARRYASTVRHCYQEQGLKGDPSLRGLLLVELVVLPTGAVQAATATATDVHGDGMPAVTTCISAVARAWRFSDGAPYSERVVLEFDLLPPSP